MQNEALDAGAVAADAVDLAAVLRLLLIGTAGAVHELDAGADLRKVSPSVAVVARTDESCFEGAPQLVVRDLCDEHA